MNTLSPRRIITVSILLLAVIASTSVAVIKFRHTTINNSKASNIYTQKQLIGVDILETVDFNHNPPQLQLHVQHVVDHHVSDTFSAIPQKLILIDKNTLQNYMELPLIASQYPSECATMMQDIDTFKKWNTQWFSVPDLYLSDESYTPRLTRKYSAMLIYEDGPSSEVFSSIGPIQKICHQIPKAIPMTPTTETDAQEE